MWAPETRIQSPESTHSELAIPGTCRSGNGIRNRHRPTRGERRLWVDSVEKRLGIASSSTCPPAYPRKLSGPAGCRRASRPNTRLQLPGSSASGRNCKVRAVHTSRPRTDPSVPGGVMPAARANMLYDMRHTVARVFRSHPMRLDSSLACG
jgi:hypothetical protein